MIFNDDYIIKLNDSLQEIVEQYEGYSVIQLAERFGVKLSSKNQLNLLTKELIKHSSYGILDDSSEQSVCFKSIKLDKYGRLKESVSLPTFKYCDIVNETWEHSQLRRYFIGKLFAFTVYKESDKKQYLNKIVVWRMPVDILEESVRTVWEKMFSYLSTGNIVKYIDDNGRYFSYFPTSSENPYIHVRPHAQNRDDTYPLPTADRLTGLVRYPKHSFWINRIYVLKIISRGQMND